MKEQLPAQETFTERYVKALSKITGELIGRLPNDSFTRIVKPIRSMDTFNYGPEEPDLFNFEGVAKIISFQTESDRWIISLGLSENIEPDFYAFDEIKIIHDHFTPGYGRQGIDSSISLVTEESFTANYSEIMYKKVLSLGVRGVRGEGAIEEVPRILTTLEETIQELTLQKAS